MNMVRVAGHSFFIIILATFSPFWKYDHQLIHKELKKLYTPRFDPDSDKSPKGSVAITGTSKSLQRLLAWLPGKKELEG